ncbi:CAP domain-containing protein [Lyngbya sp. CCY1209]|uniref:CAP domain-containing protein n=1 Tax=Lyngbya sp. CCY1209 TaxID=2886103 RepID=UPI002D2180CB|nr:CAP domain-containing protein [Lyngbya sp. CCY1209]MEB3885987.1 CAP domain-containing protein [Lyngbya sp. CCY1209]
MVLTPDGELGALLGEDNAEQINLFSGQLSGFPGGLLALGGNDTVAGSDDDELIIANRGADSVFGAGGADRLYGGKENDILDGGGGDDHLFGNLDADTVVGGDGNDSLFGGQQNDQLIGGAGSDTLYGDLGMDTVTGGEGSDVFALASGGRDVITDFEDNIDRILLPDGIAEIQIRAIGVNQTLITVANTGEELAVLEGIAGDAMDENDFVGNVVIVDNGGPTEPPTGTSFPEQVIELTNNFRAQNGLSPLEFDPQLATAAQTHTENMAFQDFFSHTGADGSDVGDRVTNTGYNYSTVGENIGAGYQTPEAVVQGWIESPGHRANLLNPDFQEIGVGYFLLEEDTGNENWNYYWTQVFGAT